jgi:hypothetical protein
MNLPLPLLVAALWVGSASAAGLEQLKSGAPPRMSCLATFLGACLNVPNGSSAKVEFSRNTIDPQPIRVVVLNEETQKSTSFFVSYLFEFEENIAADYQCASGPEGSVVCDGVKDPAEFILARVKNGEDGHSKTYVGVRVVADNRGDAALVKGMIKLVR